MSTEPSIPNAQLQLSDLILWYLCRWQIEVFCKILKSGCQVDQLRLETHLTHQALLTSHIF